MALPSIIEWLKWQSGFNYLPELRAPWTVWKDLRCDLTSHYAVSWAITWLSALNLFFWFIQPLSPWQSPVMLLLAFCVCLPYLNEFDHSLVFWTDSVIHPLKPPCLFFPSLILILSCMMVWPWKWFGLQLQGIFFAPVSRGKGKDIATGLIISNQSNN